MLNAKASQHSIQPTIEQKALEWRRPGSILPLDTFDTPRCHRREKFDADQLAALVNKLKAGSAYKPSPLHIHNAIRTGELSSDDQGYLYELFIQFGPWSLRRFLFFSGVTPYELARAMIASNVRHQRATSWMNGYSSIYDGYDPFEKVPDLGGTPWS